MDIRRSGATQTSREQRTRQVNRYKYCNLVECRKIVYIVLLCKPAVRFFRMSRQVNYVYKPRHCWGERIRTFGCWSQSPVPYRLATPHHYHIISKNTCNYNLFVLKYLSHSLLKRSFKSHYDKRGKLQ